MLWKTFSLTSRTELVLLEEDTLTPTRCITNISPKHVVLYAPVVEDNFSLVHYNVLSYVPKYGSEILCEVNLLVP